MKSVTNVWRDAVRDDQELDGNAKLVAHTLATYMNAEGLAWPSIALLARGCSFGRPNPENPEHVPGRRTVQKALRRLEEVGFLTVSVSRGRTSSRYLAAMPPTAHDVRRSEWSTAHRTTSNRAQDDPNRAHGAPESFESDESGAEGASPLGAAPPAACSVCGQVGHPSSDCPYAQEAA